MRPILIFGKYCLAFLSREQIEHIGLNREVFQRLTIRNQTLSTRAELATKEAKKLRETISKMQARHAKKIDDYKRLLRNQL